MTHSARARAYRTLAWLVVAAAMAVVVLARLELSFDLSAFLPARSTLSHEILIEQIRSGPSSRMLVMGIGGAEPAELADVSDRLASALAENDAFATVVNGTREAGIDAIPEPVGSYYLLMRDVDYGVDALESALRARVRDLSLGGGAMLRTLVARDPFLVTEEIARDLSPMQLHGDHWFAADGSAVLVAETRGASVDIGAQQAAVDAIRRAFERLPGAQRLNLDVTGVGAFSVELRETIRAEATKRSVLASVALMLVLLLIFRKPSYVVLAALPLGMGMLAGLAFVSLIFNSVHGITLAFGFTMLGIAIDYPLHLFSHARHGSPTGAIASIWPTMLLGAASTVVAYMALVLTGSEGLAQLGLFTTAGVVVALLVTRTWLPVLVGAPGVPTATQTPTVHPRLSVWPGLVLLSAAVAAIWVVAGTGDRAGLWDDALSRLSPVPAERLRADATLRSAAGTPELRYQLVLHQDSLEALLSECERAEPLLAEAQRDGLLGGWTSICQLLPSRESQLRRRAAIPDEETLRQRVERVAAATPFRADAFEPFVANAAASARGGVLESEDFRGTRLRSWLESHLIEVENGWAALLSLSDPDPEALAARVRDWPVEAELVDLQAASVELMRDYRRSALRVIALAALGVVGLLWFARGDFRQVLWIALTVASALAVTVAAASWVHGGLTVVHLVALLLVLGIGLDYSLFLSRAEAAEQVRWTRKGVLACSASTTIAFAILAGSSIPVLSYIGLTVAAGSAASYLIALAGRRGSGAS